MKRKIARAYVKQVKNDEGLLKAVVGSTDAVDRYGEIVDQKSWDLKNYKKNPVILWAHNMGFGEDRPSIGKAVNVAVKNGKLVFDIQFDMADTFAAEIFRKFKEGFLNAFSVGFMPRKIKEYDEEGKRLDHPILMDNELLELSAVPVPANAEALQQLRMQSFRVKTWDKIYKEAGEEDEGEVVKPTVDTPPTPPANDPPAPPVDPPTPPVDPPTPPISDVTNPEKTDENKGGPDSDPKKAPQGVGNQKLIRIIRESTKMLQGALAEYNQSLRK